MGCAISKPTHSSAHPKGVSVHWLNTGFIQEVREFGKNTASKIYEIEDLRSEENGLIRGKGEHIICPRDGRLGAAYVDCLKGKDHVGPSNIMLSYGWGNQIGDIAHTLMDHCRTNNLDPKRTYIWICCLCNNQHRVAEDKRLGKEVPFEEFESIFRDKVLGIGSIVALMAPWNDPIYLTRVWCIFELFTSHENNCNLTIAMPMREKRNMIQDIQTEEGIPHLFEVFASTAVEKAEASEESDKIRILGMVKDSIGFEHLNNEINTLLRNWVKNTIFEAVEDLYTEHLNRDDSKTEDYDSSDEEFGYHGRLGALLSQIGHALDVNGEHEEAIKVLSMSLKVTRTAFGDAHIHCATVCANLGIALMNMGHYENALAFFREALSIQQQSEDLVEPSDLAKTVMSIGAACFQLDKYNDALECYLWSLDLFIRNLGEEHVEVASNYDNLGSVFKVLHKMEDASESYRKAIKIREKLLGQMHPDTALSYNNYASLLSDQDKQDDALVYFQKTLDAELKLLGENHYNTAITFHNIGLAHERKKEFNEALTFYQKSMEIKVKVLGGENHPSVSNSYLGIGSILSSLDRKEDALNSYEKALEIHKNTVNEENSSAATLYYNMACVLAEMKRYQESLENFNKANEIWIDSLGPDHDYCKKLVQSMNVVTSKMKEAGTS